MKNTPRNFLLVFAALLPLGAAAEDRPGRHPAYLHALTDLRAAHSLIEHRPPGSAQMRSDEQRAILYINEAIKELKRAAIDDGKNLDEHPPEDAQLDRSGQLHRADELLRKARSDIAREEDNRAARGLRDRAIRHVDEAIRATDRAIEDVGHRR